MKTIDQLLEETFEDTGSQQQLPSGKWITAKPVPYHYGPLTRQYWSITWTRIKDACAVLRGKAFAVKEY